MRQSFGRALAAVATLFIISTAVMAQITIPNTFTPGTTISSTQMNANFTAVAAALNRAGGTMTGTLTSQQITPSSTATYDLGTTASRFRDAWLSRTLTVGGGITAGSGVVGIVDSTGKIPALSSTYIADLSAANLTSVPAANLTGTIAAISGANVTNLNASNLASGTIPDARFPATLPAVSGASLTGINSVPSGLIAFSASGSCPSGWAEYTSARGRVIVGLPSAGTNAGTVGSAYTNLENRTHTHTMGGSVRDIQSGTGQSVLDGLDATTGATSATPPYIQLIVCQKS